MYVSDLRSGMRIERFNYPSANGKLSGSPKVQRGVIQSVKRRLFSRRIKSVWVAWERMSTRWDVALACGHGFIESRPEGMVWPVQNELRACGHSTHYPRKYRASYRQLPNSIAELRGYHFGNELTVSNWFLQTEPRIQATSRR